MAERDPVAQWKAFTPDQRELALKKMTPAQKQSLKGLIEKSGTSNVTAAPAAPIGDLDYHPPGTDATPLGSFGDKYIRPIANTERAFMRTPGALLTAAKTAIANAPQSIKQDFSDFAHPAAALRRDMGITMAPDGQPLPPNTDSSNAAPKVDYDRELPDLIGNTAMQTVIAEGAMRLPEIAETVRTPGGLRKRAQDIVSAGARSVADDVAKTAAKAKEERQAVAEANKAGTERTLKARGVVDQRNALRAKSDIRAAEKVKADNAKTIQAHAADLEKVKADNAKAIEGHAREVAEQAKAAKAAEDTERVRQQTFEEHGRLSREQDQAYTDAEIKANRENDQAWNDLRKKTAGKDIDIGPVQDVVKAEAKNADPATSPIYRSITNEGGVGYDAEGRPVVNGQVRPVIVNGAEEPLNSANYDRYYEAQYGEPPPLEGQGGKASFDRLQRWYSYISNRMYGGGQMEGYARHSLDMVRKSIGNAMQQIAKESGAEDELARARELHTQKMETFSDSPNEAATVASKSLQETSPEYVKEQARQKRLEKVARYDPSITNRAERIRSLEKTMNELPSAKETGKANVPAPEPPTLKPGPEPPALKPLPAPSERVPYREPLPNKPHEVPEVDVRKVREQMILRTAARWRETSQYMIRRLAASSISGIIATATGHSALEGASAGFLAAEFAPKVMASLIEKPKVLEWLARPSVEDIRAIRTIPDIDQVKILDGLTQAATDEAKAGGKVKLAADVARLIGPDRVALITAASAAAHPKTAGEAKKLAQASKTYSQNAVGKGGHRIGSNDGNNWFDIETGQRVQ